MKTTLYIAGGVMFMVILLPLFLAFKGIKKMFSSIFTT